MPPVLFGPLMPPVGYGTDVRAWPDYGYFFDYRNLLAEVIATTGSYHATVSAAADDAGCWFWSVGRFSWTPYGDLWEPRVSSTSPNQARARAAATDALTRLASR